MLGCYISNSAPRRCVFVPVSWSPVHPTDTYIAILPVYIRTDFEDPLLCITTSITLRDKPLSLSTQRLTLSKLIEEAGSLPPLTDTVPTKERDIPTIIEPGSPKRVERDFLEEVNLLEDLSFGEL